MTKMYGQHYPRQRKYLRLVKRPQFCRPSQPMLPTLPITIRPIQCPYGPLQTQSWVYPVPEPPPLVGLQETKISSPIPTPTPTQRWYINDNIHTYTHYWRDQLPTLLPHLLPGVTRVDAEDWTRLKLEIAEAYQQHTFVLATLANIHQYYRVEDGSIWNPELPGLNSAVLLFALWTKLKQLKEPSLFAHFQETLFGIGTTCLAGITDRLLADWVALQDEKS
jgi:hypothetical protein